LNILGEHNSKSKLLKERAHDMIHYLNEWECAPLALFYALKCQVVSKERLRTIVTLFNGIADELSLNNDFANSNLGFDEIVEAASKHRDKRKGIN
jgi:hypothetical protein